MEALDNQELKNVNGGTPGDKQMLFCPKCNTKFDGNGNKVTHGSGCDEELFNKCPNCGHEFK